MASKSRVANTALNTAAGITAKMVNIITGFVMRTVFIYTLGNAYNGISSLFTDVLTMLSFAELGISSAIVYALYKPIAEKDHERIAMLMNFYKKAYRIVALVVLLAGLALVPFLDLLVPPDKIGGTPEVQAQILKQLTLIYILYVINSAVSYLLIYKTSLLTAHQEHRYVSVVQTCVSLVKVGVECAILFGFKNYEYCFIIYLVAGIILTRTQNAISAYIATKKYPEIKNYSDKQLPADERKKLFKNIGALMVYKVCKSINASIDSIIISSLFGSLWVGLVSNYRLVTSKLNMVIDQFYYAASPSIGNLATESDENKQYRAFKNLFFLAFWMQCFCVTSLVVLLNPFVEIWLGAEYVKSIWVPISLVLNVYLGCIVHPISTFRTTNGLFTQGWMRPLIMLVINIGLSIGLAYWWGTSFGTEWGIVGVKFATAISQILTLQWFDPWLVYRNVFKRSVRDYFKKILMYTAITVLSAAVTYLFSTLIRSWITNIYLAFLILMIICVVIPNSVVMIIFRKTEEYIFVKNIFLRFANKLKKKSKKAVTKSA